MTSHIWNLIYGINETFHRKENHEFGANRCKPLPLEWISNGILLHSTGNYVGSLVMEHDNVRKKNVYMYM